MSSIPSGPWVSRTIRPCTFILSVDAYGYTRVEITHISNVPVSASLAERINTLQMYLARNAFERRSGFTYSSLNRSPYVQALCLSGDKTFQPSSRLDPDSTTVAIYARGTFRRPPHLDRARPHIEGPFNRVGHRHGEQILGPANNGPIYLLSHHRNPDWQYTNGAVSQRDALYKHGTESRQTWSLTVPWNGGLETVEMSMGPVDCQTFDYLTPIGGDGSEPVTGLHFQRWWVGVLGNVEQISGALSWLERSGQEPSRR